MSQECMNYNYNYNEQIACNNVSERFWTQWYCHSKHSKHIITSWLIINQDSAQLVRNFIDFIKENDDTSLEQIRFAWQLTCSLTW